MTRHFTGWHMATILIAFFGTVIAVNLIMARAAIGTFGGTVVDNSYVASQSFNRWIEQGRAQSALGWTVQATILPDRRLGLAVSAHGTAVPGASAMARARHPLGQRSDVILRFRAGANGLLVSDQPLPEGRWSVEITARRGTDRHASLVPVS